MNQQAPKSTRGIHFQNLDSLRTLAFLSIFIHHGLFTESAWIQSTRMYEVLEYVKAPAGFGVPLFFVLSGFLISYLILEEKKRFGTFSIKNFYIRRFLRIWPLYYAVIIFGFVIFPWLRSLLHLPGYIENANPWMYAAFLGNFDQIKNGLPYGAGLGVTWSLSVEEQFYIFWPALLLFFSKKMPQYILAISVIIISMLCKWIFWWDDSNTLVCMGYLGLGALLSFAVQYNFNGLKKIQSIPKIGLAGIYLLGICILYIHPYLYFAYTYPFFILLIGLFFVFVVYDQAFNPHSFFKLKKIPWFEKLGKYTYGFYLIHTISNFVVYNLFQLTGLNGKEDGIWQFLILRPLSSLLLTIVLGMLSYRFFEKPFLNLKNRFSKIKTSS
jgi:peptidoglycan/LPS O-acetylase OafA/YrhL